MPKRRSLRSAARVPPGYAHLARLRAASLLGQGDKEAAAKAYDEIANDESFDGSLRDDARSSRSDAARSTPRRLRPSSSATAASRQPGSAFHASMNELLALSAMKAGDYKAAGKYVDAILADMVAPPALRNRAQAWSALVAAGPATPMQNAPAPARVVPVGAATPKPAPATPALSTPR